MTILTQVGSLPKYNLPISGVVPGLLMGPSASVTIVRDTMATMKSTMESYTAKVDTTLKAIADLPLPSFTAPTIPAIVRPGDVAFPAITPLDQQIDTTIDVALPTLPGAAPLTPAPTVASRTFAPSISAGDINIPASPAPINTAGMPLRPSIDTAVDMPDRPVVGMPTMASLDSIAVPTFTFPTLPVFDAAVPSFKGTAPDMVLNWKEPAYQPEIIDEAMAAVRRMLAGGTGLPSYIEQMLFDRARAREDLTAAKSVAEAFDTFASRGFSMPPGVLVAQANAAREINQLQANALQREILIKVVDTEIENMRQAVVQGIAAEQVLLSAFNNAAQRSFEMARLMLESQLALYNAEVQVFNAHMGAYQIQAQVFKTRIDAELARVEMFKAELDAARVRGELNLQKVQVFNAQVQALLSQVEIYKAEMQGASIQAEVIKSQIEAYRTDVSAYAERINADKTRFDAYRTQVEAESSKIGIMKAEADVFQTLVQSDSVKIDAWSKQAGAEVETIKANTQRFAAQVDLAGKQISARLGTIEAAARVKELEIKNMTAQVDAGRAKVESDIRIGEQQLQSSIAAANINVKVFEVMNDALIKQAELKARSLQAVGQMASTMAGGAMAAQHVQASIGASSSEGQSFSFSQGVSHTQSVTKGEGLSESVA